MAHQLWLSFPLNINDPRPPAIPAPELSPLLTIEKDGAAVQILRVASHTGTHVDAPRHVVSDGLSLSAFTPDEFLFTKPAVVNLSMDDTGIVTPEDLSPWKPVIRDADIILCRFGRGDIRRTDPVRFSTRCPGFGTAAATWLREKCRPLRAIGMDVPSLACIASLEETMAAHEILLGGAGRRFLVIEDMNLAPDLTGLYAIRICPWLVTDMDSGPCSVIGFFNGTRPEVPYV